MRVLICGSRDFDQPQLVKEWVQVHPEITSIISGGARGADTNAAQAAKELNIPFQEYTAYWDRWGKGAGVRRNQEMLVKGQPDKVWAFSFDIRKSKGTKDMIRRALKASVPVTLFDTDMLNGQPVPYLVQFSSSLEFEAFVSAPPSQSSPQASPLE